MTGDGDDICLASWNVYEEGIMVEKQLPTSLPDPTPMTTPVNVEVGYAIAIKIFSPDSSVYFSSSAGMVDWLQRAVTELYVTSPYCCVLLWQSIC